MQGTASSVNTINGIVTETGNTAQIDKAGFGKVIFAGANQFAGQLNLNQGIIDAQNNTALGIRRAA